MSELYERFAYIYNNKSLREISSDTGIPYSTLTYFSEGKRGLPTQYVPALNNEFVKSAYNGLRGSGMSSYQANRFKWYSAEQVLSSQAQMESAIDAITRSQLDKWARLRGLALTDAAVLDRYHNTYSDIWDNMRTSKQPPENTWEKYL